LFAAISVAYAECMAQGIFYFWTKNCQAVFAPFLDISKKTVKFFKNLVLLSWVTSPCICGVAADVSEEHPVYILKKEEVYSFRDLCNNLPDSTTT
jgi:hypothetical protein